MQIRRGDLKIVSLLGVLFASLACCESDPGGRLIFAIYFALGTDHIVIPTAVLCAV
jgi:hypothetical protein